MTGRYGEWTLGQTGACTECGLVAWDMNAHDAFHDRTTGVPPAIPINRKQVPHPAIAGLKPLGAFSDWASPEDSVWDKCCGSGTCDDCPARPRGDRDYDEASACHDLPVHPDCRCYIAGQRSYAYPGEQIIGTVAQSDMPGIGTSYFYTVLDDTGEEMSAGSGPNLFGVLDMLIEAVEKYHGTTPKRDEPPVGTPVWWEGNWWVRTRNTDQYHRHEQDMGTVNGPSWGEMPGAVIATRPEADDG